jgi:hypothetical protein
MTYTPLLIGHLRCLEAHYPGDVHRAKAALLKACRPIPNLGAQANQDAQQCAQIDLSLAALCRCRLQQHLARAAAEGQGCKAA